jgi:hypothetical protein
MADANARLEHLRRRNTVWGQTEPIFHRQHVSAEEEEEEDLESSYLPSGRTEPSLSFTATATSHARSGSQLAPAQALAMAQELLCYQPTTDGREGWRARIAELVAIANEDPALGGAQGAGEPAPGPRPLCLRPPWSTSDAAPSPIKTPRWEKSKDPINFLETHRDPPPSSTRDREGPEALPGTLSERGMAIGGLLHHHACLRRDE